MLATLSGRQSASSVSTSTRSLEQATYRVKRCVHDGLVKTEQVQRFDPRELLARILIHVPEPRFKLIRYYGRVRRASQGPPSA